MTVTAASTSSAQTALAVLTRTNSPAAGKPAASPMRAESPAVVMDARTARLAETARAAQAGAGASPGVRPETAATAAPDTKTAQLVETAQAAAAAGVGAASSAGYSERVGAGVQSRFKMADDSDRWVEQARQILVRSKETVRLYEETGNLYSPDMHGNLELDRSVPPATAAQKQEIIDSMRKGIVGHERVLPELEAMAKKHREDAEVYANAMRGR